MGHSNEKGVKQSLKDMGQHVKKQLEGESDDLLDTLRVFVRDAEELLQATSSASAEGLASTREQFRKRLDEVREQLSTVSDQVRHRAQVATAATARVCHRKPLESDRDGRGPRDDHRLTVSQSLVSVPVCPLFYRLA